MTSLTPPLDVTNPWAKGIREGIRESISTVVEESNTCVSLYAARLRMLSGDTV